MRRACVLFLVWILTACGGSAEMVCGGCPGPGYVLSGVPDRLAHAVVRVCLGGAPCTTAPEREPLRAGDTQFLALPPSARWEDYDGRTLRVTVRTAQARWRGTGVLRYRPSDGSTCDCSYLSATVALESFSRGG